MAKTRNIGLATLAALALSACSQASSSAPAVPPDRQADEAAIRAVLAANGAASTARNVEGVAATYTEDGDVWLAGQGSKPTAGHEAIAAGEKQFDSMPGFESWEGTVDRIRFISRDAAIAEVTGTTTMDSGKYPEKTTLVLARSGNDWKIAAARVMDFDSRLLKLMQD